MSGKRVASYKYELSCLPSPLGGNVVCALPLPVPPHSSVHFHKTFFSVELQKKPVEGFSAGLIDDDNLFEWEVMIIGPPETF